MSWTRGDLITASKLNTENGAFYNTISIGDHGYSDWEGTYYFYCTKRSGTLINISCQFGWNSHGWAELYRWENNAWAKKRDGWGGTSGWWSWSWDKGDGSSYGEGYYKLWLGFGHFSTLTVKVYNACNSCNRGNKLLMISNMGLLTSDSQPSSARGSKITASDLNAGKVYTL